MTGSLLPIVDRFAGKRVLVLGDAMLDSYLLGRSTRLCQEAPVPVVAVHERRDCPGGAANTAVNLAALGCHVELATVVGDDHEGDRLAVLLGQHGVGTELLVRSEERRTLAKQRIVNGSALLARVDQGDTGPVSQTVERRLLQRLEAAFVVADAVVISDYGYGVLTDGLLRRLRALQERFTQLVAVDARDLTRYRSIGITVAKPNFEEALRLAGLPPGPHERSRADLAIGLGGAVHDRTGARIAAITLDVDGAVVIERGRAPYRTYAEPVDASQTAGAGDTYLAALTLALASGAVTPVAAEIAAGAASVVVSQAGTACCTTTALRAVLRMAVAVGSSLRGAVGAGVNVEPGISSVEPGTNVEPDVSSAELDVREEPEHNEERDGRDHADLGARRAPALHQA